MDPHEELDEFLAAGVHLPGPKVDEGCSVTRRPSLPSAALRSAEDWYQPGCP
jgi:hypothetical protein